ncbi:FtsX-like permease family protein [Roseivirga sp.]|uniref:FtsX-like permease family protein n=1 Tax=Roseivirga sp. TaxID=1964215 RepID=UPI003B8E650D
MENNQPPQHLQNFLNWFCDDELAEGISGDLYEGYRYKSENAGRRAANRWYFINVLKFLKPQFMQKIKRTQDFTPKFGNYFKVAVRNVSRHKLVAGINLVGLTLGLAVMIFSAEYLRHQLTSDQYMADSDRIYRIVRNYRSQTYANLGFPGQFGTSRQGQLVNMQSFGELPEVEEVGQFVISNSDVMGRGFFVRANERRFRGGPILYTNTPESLQNIFGWNFLRGSMPTNKEGVILTDKVARRYFGESANEAVGKSIKIDEKAYVVNGVVKHIPENSHFDFNLIAVVDSIPYSWGAYTYAKLEESTKDIEAVGDKITKASYLSDPDAETDPLEKGLALQPLKDIHLGSEYLYEIEPNVKPVYLYLFGVVGLLVLIITITNYVNLAVAINANRLKEVGVRKVIGAKRKDVFTQFMFEAVLSTLIGLSFAILIVYTLLPQFNQLLSVNLAWSIMVAPSHLLLYVLFSLLVGIISGIYPSVLLSSRPLLGLLGKHRNLSIGKMSLRKILLGMQFFLLVLMTGFGFYVNRQLKFVTETDLGFEKEGIMSFYLSGLDKIRPITAKLLANPNIKEVGRGGTPANLPFNTVTYKFENNDEVFDDANQVFMDYATVKMLGLNSAAFTSLDEGKEKVVLLNRAAGRNYERLTGEPMENLIGQNLIQEPEWTQDDGTVGDPEFIDGFIEDFHYFSKRESFSPLFIQVYNDLPWGYGLNVKMDTENLFETMSFIREAYAEVEKERPFNYKFLDDKLQSLYAEESKVGLIVKILSILSVVLASAGLIGLTYYNAKMKQREIAIRKVLGADTRHILKLMSQDFFRIGLIALVAALPLTIYAINLWLDNFAFHIDTELWVLLVIGGLGLSIMLFGVLTQSYRTTRINLVEPLKQD